jgi:hypothetical protein
MALLRSTIGVSMNTTILSPMTICHAALTWTLQLTNVSQQQKSNLAWFPPAARQEISYLSRLTGRLNG